MFSLVLPQPTDANHDRVADAAPSHLLEKIQALGQKNLEKTTGTTPEGEQPLPAPIKRRLLA